MRQPVCHLESEAEYFHRRDAELIGDLRRRAASDERRQCLAETCQTRDPRILDALEKLGYDQNTISLLYFVPLVQVAWIDGSVSVAERNRIIVIAALRGIKDHIPAYQQLLEWLDRRPTEEFFSGTLRVIQAIFESLPENERNARQDSLVRCCREVAFASCGLFGWRTRVCLAKRRLIREIAALLHSRQQAAVGA